MTPNCVARMCMWVLLMAATSGCVGEIGDAPPAPPVIPAISTPPIARLTNAAYANTVRDLFPSFTLSLATMPPDTVVGDFDNDVLAQAPTSALIGAYQANAEAVATLVTADMSHLTGCAQMTQPCVEQWAQSFAGTAFRRPLDADQAQRLLATFRGDVAAYDLQTATSLLVQGVLQAPAFLYRAEVGEPAADDPNVAQLDGYELASRLSYFVWNSMPDATLLSAAAVGTLDTADGVEAETRRMLADPKARDAVARFESQWLRFDQMTGLTRDPAVYPLFNAAMADAMRTSAIQYVDKLFWDDGTLETLLTDTHAYVNNALAPVYGVTASSDALTWMDVGETRSGILTQAGVMAALAHPAVTAPVLRGVFVLDRFMCDPPPPPPPGVNTAITPPPPGTVLTTRQELEQTHVQGTCAGCHTIIDGVGFGFEHFDAIGAWRDSEFGEPIDASGQVLGSEDMDGDFNGVVALAKKLVKAESVRRCVASKWLEYSLGLDDTQVDQTTTAALIAPFVKTEFDMRELIVDITTSRTFRYRTLNATEAARQ